MIENRLYLNEKVKYTLPDEVVTGIYMNKYQELDFIPDVCLCVWGAVGKLSKPRADAKQIWVKTSNKDLIDFIVDYDWSKEAHRMATPNLNMWKFKKIILEEFYNKRGCDIDEENYR